MLYKLNNMTGEFEQLEETPKDYLMDLHCSIKQAIEFAQRLREAGHIDNLKVEDYDSTR